MDSVVRVAKRALQPEPVVSSLTFGATVVARDDGTGVDIFWRHGLRENGKVKVPELSLHVDAALTADGASIRGLHVHLEAAFVDTVTALHEYDSLHRVEEVISANGAVAVYGPLDALVFASHGDASHTFLRECQRTEVPENHGVCHRDAHLAVEKVLPQPLPDSAEPAV